MPGVDMNTFEVAVRVGHMLYGDMVGITALVDTGATDTVLPTSFLHELGVQPDMKVQVAYADGEIRETDSGQTRIAYNGVERVCPVLFGEEDIYLLGATTLEILKLMVDPVNQELVPAPPMRGRSF